MNFLAKPLNKRSDGALYIRDKRITLGLHDEQALYPDSCIGGSDANPPFAPMHFAPGLMALDLESRAGRAIHVYRTSPDFITFGAVTKRTG
jgi:hypothetical protein